MRFKERVRIVERYKEWLNEKPIVLDSPQTMLAFLDINGYLNKVVRCKDCKDYDSHDHRCKFFNHGIVENDYCSRVIERKKENEK